MHGIRGFTLGYKYKKYNDEYRPFTESCVILEVFNNSLLISGDNKVYLRQREVKNNFSITVIHLKHADKSRYDNTNHLDMKFKVSIQVTLLSS